MSTPLGWRYKQLLADEQSWSSAGFFAGHGSNPSASAFVRSSDGRAWIPADSRSLHAAAHSARTRTIRDVTSPFYTTHGASGTSISIHAMSVNMKWAVFVDLARPLERDEQERLTEALDLVGGGCVGPSRNGSWEAFFALHAQHAADADATAHRAIEHALQRAGVQVQFSITVQHAAD